MYGTVEKDAKNRIGRDTRGFARLPEESFEGVWGQSFNSAFSFSKVCNVMDNMSRIQLVCFFNYDIGP